MLAAVIIGHDYIGPVHADLTDWPGAAGTQSAVPATPESAAEDRIAVPVQARSPADSDRSADESVEPDQVADPAGHLPIAQERAERQPAEQQADRQTQSAEPVQPVTAAVGPRGEDDAVPAEVLPVEQLVPLPAADADGGPYDPSSRRPAYRGARYQGFPPQYQPDRERPDSEQAVGDAEAAGAAGDQPDRPAPLAVSKMSRSRRSTRGEHETKTRAQSQERQPTAADTVV